MKETAAGPGLVSLLKSISPSLAVQTLLLFQSGIQPGPQLASELLLLGFTAPDTEEERVQGERLPRCERDKCSQSSASPPDNSFLLTFKDSPLKSILG